MQAFRQELSPDFLQSVQCDLSAARSASWLSRLLQSQKSSVFTLHALLLVEFLGHTLESFVLLPAQQHPFGHGPWPCLNPVCPHYEQPHITACQVVYTAARGGRPHGTFACDCGFTYSRIGPDRSAQDLKRIGKIEAVGLLWASKLRDLWYDPQVNTKAMARILGMD